MRTKHIYWFAYFNVAEPSVRYRGLYALQYLREQYNISWDIVYPGYDLHSIFTFLRVYSSILFFRRTGSVIVFQKIYRNGIYTTALKLLLICRPSMTIYDIDDAEYLRYPDNVIKHFMSRCSAVAVGSEALRIYAEKHNISTFLLTSPVMKLQGQSKRRHRPVRVGWIGYYGAHRANLHQLLFPAITALDRPLALTILGVKNQAEVDEIKAYFQAKTHIEVTAPLDINWLDEGSVYDRIAALDIGAAPLLDTAFNRAKSAFKLKQCLACGVPVIGSPVGENKRFLQDQINGLIAADKDAFYTGLKLMCDIPDERYAEMSKAACATQKAFDMKHYTEVMISILEKTA